MEINNISIIIPCYNESENLIEIINKCQSITHYNNDLNIEFVLVDNGSTDNSLEILTEKKYSNIKIVHVKKNIGYGNGIIQGLKVASNSILSWTHADLQTDISDIISGLKFINNDFTLIKGKRIKRSFFPKILSLGMSMYTYLVLGIWVNEINAQPKIFKKTFFEDVVDNAPLDFSLDLYFCINALKKGNVIEFPVYFKKRIFGEAKGGGGSISQRFKIIKRTIKFINEYKL